MSLSRATLSPPSSCDAFEILSDDVGYNDFEDASDQEREGECDNDTNDALSSRMSNCSSGEDAIKSAIHTSMSRKCERSNLSKVMKHHLTSRSKRDTRRLRASFPLDHRERNRCDEDTLHTHDDNYDEDDDDDEDDTSKSVTSKYFSYITESLTTDQSDLTHFRSTVHHVTDESSLSPHQQDSLTEKT